MSGLPDEIVNEIFLYFYIDKRELNVLRKSRSRSRSKRGLLANITTCKHTLYRLMLTCKQFLRVARKILDPSILSDKALLHACKAGLTDYASLLLADKRVNPAAKNHLAIQLACEANNLSIVQLLLQDGRTDPSNGASNCVRIALQQKNTEIAKLLLADNRVSKFSSMKYACEFGNIDIIRELHKDPEIQSNFMKFSRISAKYNQLSAVKELISIFGYVEGTLNEASSRDWLDMVTYLLQFVKPRAHDILHSGPKSLPLLFEHFRRSKKLDEELFVFACSKSDIPKLEAVMNLPGFELEPVLSQGIAAAFKDEPKAVQYLLLDRKISVSQDIIKFCIAKDIRKYSRLYTWLLPMYNGNSADFFEELRDFSKYYFSYDEKNILTAIVQHPHFEITEEHWKMLERKPIIVTRLRETNIIK